MTVNVSSIQFKTRRLIDGLLAATREFELAPSDIEIELTETALMSQGDHSISTLDEMGKLGFRLVVDDFGTGYSNLAYLKRFDIAKLKIDQSFVRDVRSNQHDASIVATMIALAKQRDLVSVAEGVETEEQLRFLLANGCDAYQGHLFTPARAAEEITGYLEKRAVRLTPARKVRIAPLRRPSR